jgi:hypothetical protein
MSDMKEEDAPATLVANGLSEFLGIVGVIASTPAWQSYCQTTLRAERKEAMLWELSKFADTRALLELPEVCGPKQTARRALDAVPELTRLIEAWDGQGEPSAAMVEWACGFMADFGASIGADPIEGCSSRLPES